ncbi:DUF4244 domain-containing protein [Saccharomonospora xinjiangensis]|uniref:DUF4244 domain-containing protein n=1 Tax=Saccharomonospora xinjiangensis XJ-54 TaxID=882086 RepID=I0V3M1_9PSEU|nr:DUF4244 domain-containing protein [Saccharomonospora xinjiangensis]EID54724.1 hypothetical protein SacxiDRAFT_2501 [Saccharomonospora xinjiangensis XJ-54]
MLKKLRVLTESDGGMSTAEYAMGTLAAVALAAVLYIVLSGDVAKDGLTSIIEQAFSAEP